MRDVSVSLEGIRVRWTDLLDAVARKKRVMLRDALGRSAAVSFADGALTIEAATPMDLEGLERGRSSISEAAAEVWRQQIQVVLRSRAAESAAPPSEPQRLDKRGDRQERLQVYRSKDQALDTAADLLDLELTD